MSGQVEEREQWGSRVSFILAAIGSAVGLGNFWRFPYLAYTWGGGAFFIPYLLALFFLGIPLLLYELSIGQIFQRGPVGALGKLHDRARGVGVAGSMVALIVVSYYQAVMAWSCVYLIDSFRDPLPWAVQEGQTGTTAANDYYYGQVLKISDNPADTEIVVSQLLGALVFMWVMTYLCLWKGVKATGQVVYVTMTVPIITLAVLVIRGATLEGAEDGIKAYIGEWDLKELQQGAMWQEATGQIFFSLSLALGTMIAYGSYNPPGADVVSNTIIIAMSNSAFSFFAGFAVFSILGFLANSLGVEVDEVAESGPSLAFVTYPAALAEMPAPNFFNVLFYITLLMLGIDSAFSLVESVLASIKDTRYFRGVSQEVLVLGVILVCFFLSLPYASDVGLYLLDTVDYYANAYCLLLMGTLQCIVAGWMYGHDDMVNYAGSFAVLMHELSYWGMIVVTFIVGFASWEHYDDGAAEITLAWTLPLGAAWIGFFFFLAAQSASAHSGDSFTTAGWNLMSKNVFELRELMNDTITVGGTVDNVRVPAIWGLWIKYVCPFVLAFLVALGARDRIRDGWYGGYPAFYHVLGIGEIVGVIGFTILFGVFPDLLRSPEDDVSSADVNIADKKDEKPEAIAFEEQA
eukprot:Clim_evm2s145 gene=Clim_evmTU2s145